jgi:hypothetical protein
MFTSQTKRRRCPICRHRLDAATGVSTDTGDQAPRLVAGSITCCAYCGAILVVTTTGFRLATDADLADLEPVLRHLLFEFSAQHQRGRA